MTFNFPPECETSSDCYTSFLCYCNTFLCLDADLVPFFSAFNYHDWAMQSWSSAKTALSWLSSHVFSPSRHTEILKY